jgi:hypothetical protein
MRATNSELAARMKYNGHYIFVVRKEMRGPKNSLTPFQKLFRWLESAKFIS